MKNIFLMLYFYVQLKAYVYTAIIVTVAINYKRSNLLIKLRAFII